MSGLEMQTELTKRGVILPIIFITGHGDVEMSVRPSKMVR
jgi:FixJ family two-component response regulator